MSLDTLEVEVHLIIRNKETQAHAPAFGRGIARLCEGVERTGSLPLIKPARKWAWRTAKPGK